MKKVISFSLWGDNPKYTVGAVKNAQLIEKFYPGWEGWFYCGNSVPQNIISSLKSKGAKVIPRDEPGDWTGMFWRFQAIADPEVEVMLSRDTDSRLSQREAVAVTDWLDTGLLFHVMRDHPAHSTEILGGMWGARKPILGDMIHLINTYSKGNFWQVDQNFLRQIVWPRVSYTTKTHDEFFAKQPFPALREGSEFVGDVFDENDIRHPEYWKDIQRLNP
jgi:protein O-GlcNAc transferase